MDIEFELGGLLFRWNAVKAETNHAKHGVHFENAAEAFFDVDFRLTDATRSDEARDALLGRNYAGQLLFIVHVEIEDDAVRMISARHASPQERVFYGNS
jgi:uncharacterized protein